MNPYVFNAKGSMASRIEPGVDNDGNKKIVTCVRLKDLLMRK